jgi:CHC2 zinc finger
MEENKASIWDELKRIDLVSYLDSLGHQPKLIRNNDYWYHSPFREEKTPSFKVNRQRNVWFDHGTGQGGTIIDLGVRLFNCTYHELIEKLPYGKSIPTKSLETLQLKESVPENKIEVLSIVNLKAPELTNYLSGRAIYIEIAEQYCSEVDFRIGERIYKAIGFPNRSGGFELRNHWFKGSLEIPRNVTTLFRLNVTTFFRSKVTTTFRGKFTTRL